MLLKNGDIVFIFWTKCIYFLLDGHLTACKCRPPPPKAGKFFCTIVINIMNIFWGKFFQI